jgi:hypothetical protein
MLPSVHSHLDVFGTEAESEREQAESERAQAESEREPRLRLRESAG